MIRRLRVAGDTAREPTEAMLKCVRSLKLVYWEKIRREGCSGSAAGNWMVGPPSSWSLQDQEGGVDRLDQRMRIYRLSCPAGTVSLRPVGALRTPCEPPAGTPCLDICPTAAF